MLPGAPGLPGSLIHPDRNNFAPRIGIAWKPLARTVVRTGYGINYNTGAYLSIIQQLAFQPPFSFTQTNPECLPSGSAANCIPPSQLTLGFSPIAPTAVTNNYGVDPHYRLVYVQIWNLDVQRELTSNLVLNLDYTGTKGTHLDVLEAPNRNPNGNELLNNNAPVFNFETSQADSTAQAGTVRLRRRMRHGVAIGGSYTFSKSIDDASSIGGGGAVVAQNAFNLAGERGLSSFDQRHRFVADYLVELPFGHDKRWLASKSVLQDIFGDWQWSGDWTIASGLPFIPRWWADSAKSIAALTERCAPISPGSRLRCQSFRSRVVQHGGVLLARINFAAVRVGRDPARRAVRQRGTQQHRRPGHGGFRHGFYQSDPSRRCWRAAFPRPGDQYLQHAAIHGG